MASLHPRAYHFKAYQGEDTSKKFLQQQTGHKRHLQGLFEKMCFCVTSSCSNDSNAGMDVAVALKSLQVDRKVGPVSKACKRAVSDHMSAHT